MVETFLTDKDFEVFYYKDLAKFDNELNLIDGAMHYINNDLELSSDTDKENASVGVSIKDGKYYIIILRDLAFGGRVRFYKDATLNLNGHTLNATNNAPIQAYGINLTIDGTKQGSGINAFGRGGGAYAVATSSYNGIGANLIINGGRYFASSPFYKDGGSQTYAISISKQCSGTITGCELIGVANGIAPCVAGGLTAQGDVQIYNSKIITKGAKGEKGINIGINLNGGANINLFINNCSIELNDSSNDTSAPKYALFISESNINSQYYSNIFNVSALNISEGARIYLSNSYYADKPHILNIGGANNFSKDSGIIDKNNNTVNQLDVPTIYIK